MRKSQFKSQAERGAEQKGFNFYKSSQYRWEDTADPIRRDIKYHFYESEAIEAANRIDLDLGFEAIVERVYIEYSSLNEGVEFREQFELRDLDNYKNFDVESDIIHTIAFNDGGDLPEDGYIVYYRHHMYMNYSYTIEAIEPVAESIHKTYADLYTENDSTSVIYAYVAKDLDELVEDFERGQRTPFNKINSGSIIVREFLADQDVPAYVKVEEEE